MTRRQWTRPEQIKALSLYCQLPFGQLHAKNPAIIALAVEIGRTPSSVALKLCNFASLDPELRDRGVRGMGNSSQSDREVWAEFYGMWEKLANAHVVNGPTTPDSTEIHRLAKLRIGQAFFRNSVLSAYNWKCCVTEISAPELLRASHISSWAEDRENRLNPRNGLCLNALHDAAFDRGLIAFDAQFRLVLAPRLRQQIPTELFNEAFRRHAGRELMVPDRFVPDKELLRRHRETVFADNN